MCRKLLTAALLLIAVGCTDSRESRMKRGVEFAVRRFELINSDLLTRVSFQDLASQGGSLKLFIVAAISEEEAKNMPEFCNDDPCGPDSVVLSQDEESDDIIIEGYGEDQEKPVVEKRVKVRLDQN